MDLDVLQQPALDEQATHMSLMLGHRDTPSSESGGIAQTFPPNPQPKRSQLPECQPIGNFQYLPHNYSKPDIPISGNADVDKIAAETVDLFKSGALDLRKQVDSSLREFKGGVNRSPDAALPACFESWKNLVFLWEEEFPNGGPFIVDPANADPDRTITGIFPNKGREFLQDEVLSIGTHMNRLLDASHQFLENKEDLKRQIEEKNVQLYKITVRTSTIDNIRTELQLLLKELDNFETEISDLLNDVKTAVLPLMARRKQQVTGMHRVLILQPSEPAD